MATTEELPVRADCAKLAAPTSIIGCVSSISARRKTRRISNLGVNIAMSNVSTACSERLNLLA